MEYELRYSPLYYDDLMETVDYIADELENPQAAVELIDDADKAVLARLPFAESFEPVDLALPREYPYYAIYVKNYVVYYVVIDHRIMEVRRLLYGAREKEDHLFDAESVLFRAPAWMAYARMAG